MEDSAKAQKAILDVCRWMRRRTIIGNRHQCKKSSVLGNSMDEVHVFKQIDVGFAKTPQTRSKNTQTARLSSIIQQLTPYHGQTQSFSILFIAPQNPSFFFQGFDKFQSSQDFRRIVPIACHITIELLFCELQCFASQRLLGASRLVSSTLHSILS